MATTELDSFVLKLKCLMTAGHQACLNVVCGDRKLVLDLKAEIALDDVNNSFVQPPWRQNRSPAYKRRQERRQAARSVAEEATIVKEESEEATVVNEEAEKQASSNSELPDVIQQQN